MAKCTFLVTIYTKGNAHMSLRLQNYFSMNEPINWGITPWKIGKLRNFHVPSRLSLTPNFPIFPLVVEFPRSRVHCFFHNFPSICKHVLRKWRTTSLYFGGVIGVDTKLSPLSTGSLNFPDMARAFPNKCIQNFGKWLTNIYEWIFRFGKIKAEKIWNHPGP